MDLLRDAWASPRRQRHLLWLGSLVLAVGIVGVMLMFFRNTAEVVPERISTEPAALPENPGKRVALSSDARKVAGQFILTAVGRDNLAASWSIVHPTLKQGLSRKEWLTGNIPVQYYPVNTLEVAPMHIEESYARSAMLQVALLPKKGANIKPQVFFLGLKKVGNGKNARWLVDYWAPYAPPGVHDNRSS
jgi:hypothetical protein